MKYKKINKKINKEINKYYKQLNIVNLSCPLKSMDDAVLRRYM